MANGGLPTIRLGSRGSAVAYCQNLLNARLTPRPSLWVDGIFGAKTDGQVAGIKLADTSRWTAS